MRIETLLSPGLISNGLRLRTEACKSISSIEITAGRTPGHKINSAAVLKAFFTDCAGKMDDFIDSTAPAWAGLIATVASATQINITFLEAMDQTVAPLPADFAISGDTITAVAWTTATNLRLTGTGFAAAESLGYTKPAVNAMRDLAGNQVPTGTKTLV